MMKKVLILSISIVFSLFMTHVVVVNSSETKPYYFKYSICFVLSSNHANSG